MLQVEYYSYAHVRTSFRILGSTGRIMQKFGVLLDPCTYYACYTGYKRRMSASTQVRLNILFKHIASLVHPQKCFSDKGKYFSDKSCCITRQRIEIHYYTISEVFDARKY